MSETDPDLKLVTCQNCQHQIGVKVNVNGRIWLRIGNVELRNGHGRCVECQHIWHYNDLDFVLAGLVGGNIDDLTT